MYLQKSHSLRNAQILKGKYSQRAFNTKDNDSLSFAQGNSFTSRARNDAIKDSGSYRDLALVSS